MAKQIEKQKPNFVLGRVVNVLNYPLANLIVQAFDRDIRSDTLLGETITDRNGKYEITWSQSQLSGKGGKKADIVIKVFTKGKKTHLYESDMDAVRFNASPREEINITIETTIKPEIVEYDLILRQVSILANKVAITNLQENEQHRDITFLSRETEIPAGKIEHLVVAHRLGAESKIDAAFFYALLRKNTLLKNNFFKSFHVRLVIDINTEILPLLYDAALAVQKTIQRDVQAARKEMIVSARIAKEYTRYVEQLHQYRKRAEDYYKNEHPRKVLNIISRFVMEDKISEIGKLLQENKNNLKSFLKKVTDSSFFKSDEKAKEANASIALGELLGFDEAIISEVKKSQNIRKPEDVRKLAALNKAGWKEVLTKSADKITIAGKTLDRKLIDLHASSLVRKMEKEYPTVAFSAQLSRENKAIFKNQDAINDFFAKYADFDLQHTNIDLFLKTKKLAAKKNEAIREELKSIQRVFKLVPHYGKINALRKLNIHSAQSIAAIGETRFVKEIASKAGLNIKEAKAVFRKTERVNTAAMLIAGELQDTIRGMNIPALEMKTLSKKLKAVSKDFPNLKSLFKLTDVCFCEHCRSVYSPAAYLVEILQFLDKRSVTDLTTTPTTTAHLAKDVLFERRPDLGEIDLGCENATTPVPYIDLVCELLEEAVAPDSGVIYIGKLAKGTNPLTGKISNTLLAKLKSVNIPVTDQAQIYRTEDAENAPEVPIYKPHYLRDKKVVCKIIHKGAYKYKIFRLKQTLSSAEELAAAPEYVNAKVYDNILPKSAYAFKLPFNLYHTEAKAYFTRFDISRAILMEDFKSAGIPVNEAIAAEKLGLTDSERRIIVAPKPNLVDQQLIWNAPSQWDTDPVVAGNVLDYMKRVDHFLDKTGLTYKELDLLLSLEFINPTDKLFIKHNYDNPSDPNPTISCDTAKKEIAFLDAAALDRIHRFLRLQKKISWKFEVLDEIISQAKLGQGTLDDACLIKAADLLKVLEETGIKIDELVGFYGIIPHQILKDDAPKPLYHQIFLNKAKNGFIDELLSHPEEKTGSELLKDVQDSLSLCLQLSKQDYNKLAQAANVTTFGNTPFNIYNINKFSNLSYLFAASRLMKKLKLKADDFIILSELTGINISNSPEKTVEYVKAVNDSKKSQLKPADIKFLLQHEPPISDFDDRLSANEQKTTLKNLLSRLNGLNASDITKLINFIDCNWTSLNDAISFTNEKLSGLINTNHIIDTLNSLAVAVGPNIETARKDFVKALMDAINLSDREIKDDRIKQILEKLQKDYQNTFSVNKSPFDDNLSSGELKETLQNALSKLNGIGEEDIKIFIRFIDGDWTLPSDTQTFINNKLNTLITAPQITAINNSFNALETVSGPDYTQEKTNLINLLCITIDSTLDLSVLSQPQKISKLRSLLLALAGVTTIEVNSLIGYIELGNEKRFVDERLSQLFDTNSIKLAINEFKNASSSRATDISNHEANILVYKNAQETLSAAKKQLALASTPAELAAAQAVLAAAQTLLTSAEAQLAITLPKFNIASGKNLIKAFLNSIAAYQLQMSKQSILEQSLITTFKADLDLVKAILRYSLLKQTTPGDELISTLLQTDALIDNVNTIPVLPTITPGAFPKQFQSFRLLHKLIPLINSFKLENPNMEWFFRNNKGLGWFEWDGIPYIAGQTAIDYSKYSAFVKIIDLSKQLTPVPNPTDAENPITFFYVLEMLLPGSTATQSEFIEKYSLLTGYVKEEVMAIDAHLFATWDITNYRKVETWRKIEKCIEHLRKLGSTVTQIKEYIKPVLISSDADLLRMALKARYDEDTWLSTLKEIMDAIRPQKRDALVAYLLAVNPEMKDENDLYDYFLVDVEMEAAMPSSRIVQAHGTIQLFVQRCLMGLEPKAAADLNNDKSWDQWKWMKNYRVWEANRKVFLYPENWIEAELRDDKSFLFTELENELLQNELTEFTAEDALIKYLEKLDNIAFLEVMATWYQSDIKTMHVFARTKGGDPAIYYYRKFEQEKYWTPWEKVELDITGDHLLAIVRNNRLCLIWPVISEEPAPNPQSTVPDSTPGTVVDTDKPKKKTKIQLAISENVNQKWQPKRISKDSVDFPSGSDNYSVGDFERRNMNLIYMESVQQIWIFKENFVYIDPGYNPWSPTIDDYSILFKKYLVGIFNLTGCKGYPEPVLQQTNPIINDFLPDFKNTHLSNQRYLELIINKGNGLSIRNWLNFFNFIEILGKTPDSFRISYPHQLTNIDIVILIYQYLLLQAYGKKLTDMKIKLPFGTLLPYFMEDNNHAYVIIPGFYKTKKYDKTDNIVWEKRTGSDVLQLIEDIIALFNKYINLYKSNPGQDIGALVHELLNDPEFQKIKDELKVYEGLDFFYEFIQSIYKNEEVDKVLEELKNYNGLIYGEEFKNFYHPLICPLRKILYTVGISGLMKREVQLLSTDFDFEKHYVPNPYFVIIEPYLVYKGETIKTFFYPIEDIDFSTDGSYSSYNWELFFHVPFLMATRLTKNQRFEEALSWFHYMFNPTGALDGTIPQKYWVTKPFYLAQDDDYINHRIDTLLYKIADPTTSERAELEFTIDQWRKHPFKPHVVARFRTVAYQKALLMKYIDNLIEWGDYLFHQDTMESIVQATQMYILADKLLGPKPRVIPPVIKTPYETYNQIEEKLDAFGNGLIELENILPDFPDLSSLPEGGAELPSPMVTLSMLYFCIPQNDKMLEYWDRIADRLFKIRHCQNIDGVERSLALFAPPIDPGMLVRAATAGLDISTILAGINAPTPYYRFYVLSQKATELAQEVRGLGNSLLQVLEKKDAEALSLLRSELEIKVLNAVKDIKLLQIKEAKEQIEILKRTRAVTEERNNYYSNIAKIISKEQMNLDKLSEAHDFQIAAQIIQTLGGMLSLLPEAIIGAAGFGGSPHATVKWGGFNLANAAKSAADVLNIFSSIASYEANRASILGGYERRFDDWKLQERLAKKELSSIDKQITAAEIRKEISETDLKNHMLQIENAKKTDEFMRTKYTNKELYVWMIGQISSVYFKSYQLAHDFAKKAERCYQFELGNDDSFISYGYWDSMKKGLQSADQLIHDIKRMETGYLDKNKREYELTKHVSLSMLEPLSLVMLRATGACDFEVPEAIFDMDHAGHYFRRIKSVSISMPCISGPYTSVSAKLSLVSNRYRKDTKPDNAAGTGYEEDLGNDERFNYNIGTIQSIVASNAQNDSGMFELNFRDERYLPFEGTGAISIWRLELPSEIRQFDYNTISDVILHVKYTAREGGSSLKNLANASLKDRLATLTQRLSETGLHVAINMKRDLSNEWQLFKKNGSIDLIIDKSRLPYFAQSNGAEIENVMLLAKVTDNPANYKINITVADVTTELTLLRINEWELCSKKCTDIDLDASFKLSSLSQEQLNNLEELMMVVKYGF